VIARIVKCDATSVTIAAASDGTIVRSKDGRNGARTIAAKTERSDAIHMIAVISVDTVIEVARSNRVCMIAGPIITIDGIIDTGKTVIDPIIIGIIITGPTIIAITTTVGITITTGTIATTATSTAIIAAIAMAIFIGTIVGTTIFGAIRQKRFTIAGIGHSSIIHGRPSALSTIIITFRDIELADTTTIIATRLSSATMIIGASMPRRMDITGCMTMIAAMRFLHRLRPARLSGSLSVPLPTNPPR